MFTHSYQPTTYRGHYSFKRNSKERFYARSQEKGHHKENKMALRLPDLQTALQRPLHHNPDTPEDFNATTQTN